MSRDFHSFPVILGEHSFKSYIRFDAMVRRKSFKPTVRITVILYIIATVLFAYQEKLSFAYPLGCALIIAAVFIPTNFFRSFSATIKEQTEKMNLKEPREVYTIYLSGKANGISYTYPDKKDSGGSFAWKDVFGVWRTNDAIYLYLTEQRTLLIPFNDKTLDYDGIWNFITNHVKDEKIHDAAGLLAYIK